MTEQKLKEYKQLKKEVEELRNQILMLERLKEVAKVSKPKTSSSSGFKNTADQNLIRLESMKVDLNEQLNEYLNQLEEVEFFIKGLKTSLQRNIFKSLYEKGLSWEHTAVRVEKSYKQVRRIHDYSLGIEYVRDESGKMIKIKKGEGNVR